MITTEMKKFFRETGYGCGFLYKRQCIADPHAEYSETICDGDCEYMREDLLKWKEKYNKD